MKIQRSLNMLHPLLIDCVKRIQSQIIDAHNVPIRLFETGREHNRHEILINRGKTKNIISNHLYNLENDPMIIRAIIVIIPMPFTSKRAIIIINSSIILM